MCGTISGFCFLIFKFKCFRDYEWVFRAHRFLSVQSLIGDLPPIILVGMLLIYARFTVYKSTTYRLKNILKLSFKWLSKKQITVPIFYANIRWFGECENTPYLAR